MRYGQKRRLLKLVMALSLAASQILGGFGSVPGMIREVEAATDDTFEVDGITYKVLDESAKTVMVYSTDNSKISGPVFVGADKNTYNSSTVMNSNTGNSYKVTEIGDNTFKNCTNMTSIIFGPDIIRFGSNILSGCSFNKDGFFIRNCSSTSFTLPSLSIGYVWEDYNGTNRYTEAPQNIGVFPKNIGYATVTFYYNNDDAGTSNKKEYVLAGEKVAKPSPDPTKTGYVFMGWTKTKDSTDYYNFDTTLNKNQSLYLYAKWENIDINDISKVTYSGIGANNASSIYYTYDGQSHIPSFTIKNKSTQAFLVEGTDYTVEIYQGSVKDSVNVGKKLVRIIGKGIYTNYSDFKDAYEIKKADYPANKPDSTMTTDKSSLSEIALPTGWEWDNSSTTLQSGSTTSCGAKYTAQDAGNYKYITVTIQVTRSAVAVTSFDLNTTSLDLKINGTSTATITTNNILPSGASADFTWSSSDTSVATVDTSGKVTAKANGKATITATANNISRTCTVNVTTLASEVSLSSASLALHPSETGTLTATVNPSTVSDSTVTWSSSNTSVATVDTSGKVTAVANGTATITATANDGSGKTATCTVTVTTLASSVTLSSTSLTLRADATDTLTATVNPSTASNNTVTWSSSNTSVATVDSSGKVTAVASGTATITATAKDGSGKTATCTVTVYNPVRLFKLNKETLNLDGIGTTGQLSVAAWTSYISGGRPDEDYMKTLQYKSNNESVATVDSSSGKVTAKASGTATITATVTNSSTDKVTQTCEVTVTNPLKSISLDKTTLSLTGGKTGTLTVTYTPSNADADDKAITWSSSDNTVANVTKAGADKGAVTAYKSGTATITATSHNGKTAQCTVNVSNPLTGFTLSQESADLIKGGTALTLSVNSTTPDAPDDYTLTATSSNSSAAAVTVNDTTKTVTVTPKEAADNITVKVTATRKSDNYSINKTCIVNVKVPDASVTLESININPVTNNLRVGGTTDGSFTINVSPYPSNAVLGSVQYVVTSGADCVSVNSEGKVTAIASGTAVITVTAAGGKTATCTVNVTNPATSVKLNKTSATLAVNDSIKLDADILPSGADEQSVEWSSANNSIASVDSQGYVTAKATGTTNITATVSNTDITATCTVTVVKQVAPLEAIILSEDDIIIAIGNDRGVMVSPSPKDALLTDITCEATEGAECVRVSVDDNIVTVRGRSYGTAKLNIASSGKSAVLTVAVVNLNSSITIKDEDSNDIDIDVDEEGVITLPEITEVEGMTARWKITVDGEVTYSEPGAKIAYIDGMQVEAEYVAEITVTVKNIDGTESILTVDEDGMITLPAIDAADGRKAHWQITVGDEVTYREAGEKVEYTEGIKIEACYVEEEQSEQQQTTEQSEQPQEDKPSPDLITVPAARDPEPTVTPPAAPAAPVKVDVQSLTISCITKKVAAGKKLRLEAVVLPENADNKAVTWSVNNEKYASVDAAGVLTAKKAGAGKKVTVTAVSTDNEAVSATYTVQIMKKAVKKIKLSGKKTLKKGKTTVIKAKISPSKSVSKEVEWISSNEAVATVSAKGKVKAISKGKVKITAKAKDGSGKKATIKIKVK